MSASQSQSMTQSEKAMAKMTPGEQKMKICDLVKFLLVMDQKKLPIKKQDINKHVMKEHSKAFPFIMAEASKKLSKVFGIKVEELEDKLKGSYILVNKLDIDTEINHLKWSEEYNSRTGLLMIVLSMIFMSGNVMVESQLWNALRKFGIDVDVPHEVFGNVKKLLSVEFVRQGYLEVTNQTNTDPPTIEYRWGQRARLETSKRNVLTFVSQIYEIEPSQWTSQWQEVLQSEGQQQPQPSTSGR